MMKTVLVIWRKDWRRLRWEVLVALCVLAAATWQDVNRYDIVANQIESLLDLLLGAAWAYLVARAVQQERLVGDGPLWLTQPIERGSLVLAKVLFVVAFIHLPDMIADAAVLAAHQFNPLIHLSQLLWKQVIVAAVVTLPAAALAAMTRTIAQFAASGFVLVAVGVVLRFGWAFWSFEPEPLERRVISLAIIAAAALGTLVLQYRYRRFRTSWAVWLTGVVLSGSLYAVLPPDFEMVSRQDSGRHVALAPETDRRSPAYRIVQGGHEVAIPIKIAATDSTEDIRMRFRDGVTITSGDFRLKVRQFPRQLGPNSAPQGTFVITTGAAPGSLWLHIVSSEPNFAGLGGKTVRIQGTLEADRMKIRELGYLKWDQLLPVPEAGRCMLGESGPAFRPAGQVKAMCESPGSFPSRVQVRVRMPGIDQPSYQPLMPQMLMVVIAPWLSPLNRAETYLNLDRFKYISSSAELARLSNVVAVVANEPVERWTVRVDLEDIHLNAYLLDEIDPRRLMR